MALGWVWESLQATVSERLLSLNVHNILFTYQHPQYYMFNLLLYCLSALLYSPLMSVWFYSFHLTCNNIIVPKFLQTFLKISKDLPLFLPVLQVMPRTSPLWTCSLLPSACSFLTVLLTLFVLLYTLLFSQSEYSFSHMCPLLLQPLHHCM